MQLINLIHFDSQMVSFTYLPAAQNVTPLSSVFTFIYKLANNNRFFFKNNLLSFLIIMCLSIYSYTCVQRQLLSVEYVYSDLFDGANSFGCLAVSYFDRLAFVSVGGHQDPEDTYSQVVLQTNLFDMSYCGRSTLKKSIFKIICQQFYRNH